MIIKFWLMEWRIEISICRHFDLLIAKSGTIGKRLKYENN